MQGEFYDFENDQYVSSGFGIKKWAKSARIVDQDVDPQFERNRDQCAKNAQHFYIFFNKNKHTYF